MQLTKEYLEEQRQLGKTISEIAKENNLKWRYVYNSSRNLGIPFKRVRGVTKNLKDIKCGKLTVREQLDRRSKSQRFTQWLCDCECGNTTIVLSTAIIRETTHSCGCLIYEDKPNWQGYKEISGSFWSAIKSGAKRRGLEFNVTREYVWGLFLEQNRKCALTGLDIKFTRKRSTDHTASLDRIDSSKGYIEGNLQWLHKDINWFKNKWGQEDFIKMCKIVADYNS